MNASTASTQAPCDDDDVAAEQACPGHAGCVPAISVGNVTSICTSRLGPRSPSASTATIESVKDNEGAVPVYASRNKSTPMAIGVVGSVTPGGSGPLADNSKPNASGKFVVANGSIAMLRDVALHLLATTKLVMTIDGNTPSLAREVTSAGYVTSPQAVSTGEHAFASGDAAAPANHNDANITPNFVRFMRYGFATAVPRHSAAHGCSWRNHVCRLADSSQFTTCVSALRQLRPQSAYAGNNRHHLVVTAAYHTK